jgi:hypothetical protein
MASIYAYLINVGNNSIEYLIRPYVHFNKTVASITLPAVGASVCASGSHVETETWTLITKLMRKI